MRGLFGIAAGLTVLMVLGCSPGSNGTRSESSQGKEAIFDYLRKQTGQKEFKPAFDFDLAARLATLRSNANRLEERRDSIRQSVQKVEAELQPKEKEVETLREQIREIKRQLGEIKGKIAEAEQKGDRDELDRLRGDYNRVNKLWDDSRASISAKETEVDLEKKKMREAFRAQESRTEQELAVLRPKVSGLHEQLGAQENQYINLGRTQASNAPTYQALYKLIGEQLTVADRLLVETNQNRQRMGIFFAKEASRHAVDAAQNGWLAARICEFYLWPNLDRADYTPGSREKARDLLDQCRSVFSQADEAVNLKKNSELMEKYK